MTKHHAKLNRNVFRWFAAALALGGFPLICPAADAAYDAFMGKVVGNKTTVTFGTGGTPIVTSSAGLGTPTVGNMAVGGSAAGGTLSGNVAVPLGDTGKTAAAKAVAPISKAAFARALVAAGRALIPAVGVGLAAGEIYSYLKEDQGFTTIGKNPDGTLYGERTNKYVVQGYDWRYDATTPWRTSWASACGDGMAIRYKASVYKSVSLTGYVDSAGTRYCKVSLDVNIGTDLLPKWQSTTTDFSITKRVNPEVTVELEKLEEAALLDAIASESGWPTRATAALGQALNTPGVVVETGTPTVTGPATVPGQKTTQKSDVKLIPNTTTVAPPGYTGDTQPGVSTVTNTATHNVTYNNNTVTYNTVNNQTTVITNTSTGQTETQNQETQTEDDAKPEEEKPDLCQKNPDILACKKPELDVPDGEIPKTTKTVTYQEDTSFGGGTCPPNAFASIGGKQTMVYDWGQTCGVVSTYIRPIIILLGAMGALFILIPGRDS